MITRLLMMIVILGAFLVSGCASVDDRVRKIQSQYPQWNSSTVQQVAKRQVTVGMTEEMVMEALRSPDDVSHEGIEQRWGYAIIEQHGWSWHRRYVYFVYFTDGKVVRTAGDPGKLATLSWYIRD
jgi:outer membrane protein assembly factor BamE (lipoprotein component of BamABCDE complex)